MAFPPGASREFIQAGAVMTTKKKRAEQTAALHQAIQWTHRLDTEEDIETNWSEFALWLEQSPQHQEAYHRVQRGRCETELYRETVAAEGIDEEALVSELNPALPSAVVKALWASVLAILILGVTTVAGRARTDEVHDPMLDTLPVTERPASSLTRASDTSNIRNPLTGPRYPGFDSAPAPRSPP